MKKSLLFIILLFAAAAVFEFLPAVRTARYYIPEEHYVGKSCDCSCIADLRPWFSTINYRFWLWILIVPLLIFSVSPKSPDKQRIIVSLASIIFCCIIMNFAIRLAWDIRNGPFNINETVTKQSRTFTGCPVNSSGVSIMFTAVFGWIWAAVYTGWWNNIWYFYHKYVTKQIDASFRYDKLNKIITCISKAIAIIILLCLALSPVAVFIAETMQKTGVWDELRSFFILYRD